MSKKPKSTKKRAGSQGNLPARPIAVLYHLDRGTERGDAVRSVLAAQNLQVKTANETQLANPVGAFVGMTGMRMSSVPYEGEVPSGEFMLLHNVSSARLNTLLAAMREAGVSVGCKAQVTQHNRLWPLATLIREVTREHEALSQ